MASRIFASHFGHLSLVSAWLSASFFGGARYSNYMAWLADPFTVKPAAQIVYAGVNHIQDAVNGEVGAGSSGMRVTSGAFQAWRAAGLVSSEQLFAVSIACLTFALVLLVAGWFHHHKAMPTTAWFNDVDAILSHHLTAVVGLGCLAWAGHLVHVAVPTDALLRLGVDPEGLGLGVNPFSLAVQGSILDEAGAGFMSLDWRSLGQQVT